VAEVVISPRSEVIGQTVFPGLVTESGDLIVRAVQRSGEDRPGKTVLAPGDTLVLQGRWRALDTDLDQRGVLVVDRTRCGGRSYRWVSKHGRRSPCSWAWSCYWRRALFRPPSRL
jgi:hypothetical protein